jgi:hypothetical protein
VRASLRSFKSFDTTHSLSALSTVWPTSRESAPTA